MTTEKASASKKPAASGGTGRQGAIRFQSTILTAGKTTTGIQIPDEVIEKLGAGKKPAVRITINGYTALHHGTDHDSKPLPFGSGVLLPARLLQCRQEEHRIGRTTAQGFGRSLLSLPFPGAG